MFIFIEFKSSDIKELKTVSNGNKNACLMTQETPSCKSKPFATILDCSIHSKLWPNGRIKDKKQVSDVGDLLISSLLNFTTKTSFRGGRESQPVQKEHRSFNRGSPGKMGENFINHSVAYSVYVIPFILSPECHIISLHCPTNPNVCRDASRTFEYLHKV